MLAAVSRTPNAAFRSLFCERGENHAPFRWMKNNRVTPVIFLKRSPRPVHRRHGKQTSAQILRPRALAVGPDTADPQVFRIKRSMRSRRCASCRSYLRRQTPGLAAIARAIDSHSGVGIDRRSLPGPAIDDYGFSRNCSARCSTSRDRAKQVYSSRIIICHTPPAAAPPRCSPVFQMANDARHAATDVARPMHSHTTFGRGRVRAFDFAPHEACAPAPPVGQAPR